MNPCLAFTLLLALGAEPRPQPPAPFTAARFREHVAYLAADELGGRDVASEGSAKAIQYLVRNLESFGGKGLGPPRDDYPQVFPYVTRFRLPDENRLQIVGGETLKLGHDFAPSAASPDGQWEAEVVFVGYGICDPKRGFDEFAGLELKGKMAVLLGEVPRQLTDAGFTASLGERLQECEKRGAVAVLSLDRWISGHPTEGKLGGEVATRKIPLILLTRQSARKVFPGATRHAELVAAAEGAFSGKMKSQSRPLDYKLQLVVKVDRTLISGSNVLAVVPGKGPLAKEAILVSSHHDHLGTDAGRIKAGKDGIYNGADDNASGCAAVLLLAEALHADRDRLPDSCRSVIFASFDAEERGLIGSRYYVQHPLWPLERTTANLNFDMVGRLGLGRLVAMDSHSSAFLAERIETLAPKCGLRVETRLNGGQRADHQSFLDRQIPAFVFTSGLHPDYHQVSDETARIDSTGGARIAWLGYRVLRELMHTPGRLPYVRPPPTFNVEAILRLTLRLGIIPEQNAQSGKHAHVKLVLPGSFAAKHGLRSGDAIAGLNGKEFEDLVDAALAFGRLRLDRDLHLMVLRQGKKEEVVIPAEAMKDFAGPAMKPLGEGRFEVLFRFKPAASAKSVTLAGTFNGWDTKTQPLTGPDNEGFYSTRLALKPGSYEYKFVVDGQTWFADPTNIYVTGQHGNSVLTVGEPP